MEDAWAYYITDASVFKDQEHHKSHRLETPKIQGTIEAKTHK